VSSNWMSSLLETPILRLTEITRPSRAMRGGMVPAQKEDKDK